MRSLKGLLDWLAVFAIVFITTALATFFVDPTPIEAIDKGEILTRAAIIATSVTVFYASVTWLRRPESTVPDDIQNRLPSDPPPGGNP